jgi:hypothetical protein
MNFKRMTTIFCAVLLVQFLSIGIAQAQAGQPIPILVPAEIDSLVAPIALYPDPLLSQVLVASTYPLQIVQAAQWIQQNSTLTGAALQDAAKQQNWDASIQALVVFPDVIQRMSGNIQWTTDLGNSFLAQQAGVMDAVQRLRSQAMASSSLKSNPQQVVTSESQDGATAVQIEPANPEVIYVPSYNPVAIWGPAYYPYPMLGYFGPGPLFFSSGIFVGPFFAGWGGWGGWGWRPNWFGHSVIVNAAFVGRYGFNRGVVGSGFVAGGFRGTVAPMSRVAGLGVVGNAYRSEGTVASRQVASANANQSRSVYNGAATAASSRSVQSFRGSSSSFGRGAARGGGGHGRGR